MALLDLVPPGLVLAGLLLFYGAFLCFAGHRLFLMHLVFLGALVGGVVGYSLGEFLAGRALAVVLCILLALAGGLFLVSSLVIGLAAFGGTFVVFLAWPWLAPLAPPVNILAGLIAFIAGATLALVLGRFVIVLGTSLEGAGVTVTCGCAVLAGKDLPAALAVLTSPDFLDALARAERSPVLVVVAFFALFVAGMLVQYRYGKPSARS